jgi:hypothetical protein
MRPHSPEYYTEMRAPHRDLQFMRVQFGLINPFAPHNQTLTSNSEMDYSSFNNISNQLIVFNDSYSTWENNRTKADGRLLIPPNPSDSNQFITQGYISNIISDDNGNFSNMQPYIDIEYGAYYDFPGISITFDSVMEMHPTKIQMIASRNGVIIYDEIYDIDSFQFSIIYPMRNINNIRIIFHSTQEPRQFVRIMKIIYGVGISWDNYSIDSGTGITKTVDIDPINRRLPRSTATIGILDYNHVFDFDNPHGIYETIESQLPVELFYGKLIPSSGEVEWLSVGNYLLTSKPKWNKNVVELSCQDIMGFMTDEYYKGVYERNSLWDLCIEVISDAELLPRDDGREHYILWEGLRDIYTESPMPIAQHNECLRLIAHASNCVIYTDWENIIHIEPINNIQHDYHLLDDRTNQYGMIKDIPAAELIASLYAVESEITFWHEGAETETIHQSTINVNGEFSTVIKYDPAISINVNVWNGTVSIKNIFTSACELTIIANGNVSITITGIKLNTSIGVERIINEYGDINGEIETLTNQLVSSREMAIAQATYVKNWLRLRTTYKISYRGDPALEALDLIYSKSEFSDTFSARALKHEWKYSGALEGSLILKNEDSIRM